MRDHCRKIKEISKLINHEAEYVSGGILCWIINVKKGRYLTFGFANGPLGYDLSAKNCDILTSGEMDSENATNKEIAQYIKDIVAKYGKVDVELKEALNTVISLAKQNVLDIEEAKDMELEEESIRQNLALEMVIENQNLFLNAKELLESLEYVKNFFDKLDNGLPDYDPITIARRKFHQPLISKITKAINKVEGK